MNAGSIPSRIAKFFETNPDEELTFADIATKFEIPLTTARWAVNELVRKRHLESVHVIRQRAKGIAS